MHQSTPFSHRCLDVVGPKKLAQRTKKSCDARCRGGDPLDHDGMSRTQTLFSVLRDINPQDMYMCFLFG